MSNIFAVSKYGGGSTINAASDTRPDLRSRLSSARRARTSLALAQRVHALIGRALGCPVVVERLLLPGLCRHPPRQLSRRPWWQSVLKARAERCCWQSLRLKRKGLARATASTGAGIHAHVVGPRDLRARARRGTEPSLQVLGSRDRGGGASYDAGGRERLT